MINFPDSPVTGDLFTPPPPATGTFRWDGTKWVQLVVTGAPNKLLNPFMEIDQANEGALLASVSATPYLVDGVSIGSASIGTISGQRVTDAPTGYPNSVRLTVTAAAAVAAGTVVFFVRRLEADDMIDTGFGTANAQTLSAAIYLKSSVAGAYSVALRNTANNRSYVTVVTISAANTWQLFNLTIPGDTTGTWVTSGNGVGLELNVTPCAGSTYQTSTLNAWQNGNFVAATTALNTFSNTNGATFQLGPAGLWVAPAAQPLLRTSFQAELARCQRYYEKSYTVGVAPGTVDTNGATVLYVGATAASLNAGGKDIRYAVQKRAGPTVTLYSPATGVAGKIRDNSGGVDVVGNTNFGNNNGLLWYGGITANASMNLQVHFVADARL